MTPAKPMPARAPAVLAAIPNLLSLLRLALGVVFPWLPPEWRLSVIVIAAFSDLLDGAISRTLHAASTTGRVLDPVADKVFALSVLATLLVSGELQLWEAALVSFRDLAVLVGVVLLALVRGRSVLKNLPPTVLGKVTTAAQFVFFVALLLNPKLAAAIFVPAVAVSVVAGIDYLRRYLVPGSSPTGTSSSSGTS
jgi:phosphatidylglycerophosphate synthase